MCSPLLASSPAACSSLYTVVTRPCPTGENALSKVQWCSPRRPAQVALPGSQEGSKVSPDPWEMLLSQPKPGSLPAVSASGQTLLQQDLGDLPVTRGLPGVADPFLATLQLGVSRAAGRAQGKPRLSACPPVGPRPAAGALRLATGPAKAVVGSGFTVGH